MKKLLPVLLPLLIVFAACSKKIDCENAQTCVINVSTDTIYYTWVCGSFHMFGSDTLLPGDTACKYVGEVTVRSQWQSVPRPCFTSSAGDYSWEVADCYVEREID